MSLLGDRLKALRKEAGLSQEAVGAQGFVSAPGYIKMESGQRSASEKMLSALVKWLVAQKYIKGAAATTLMQELLILKYIADPKRPGMSHIVREYAASQPGFAHLVPGKPSTGKR